MQGARSQLAGKLLLEPLREVGHIDSVGLAEIDKFEEVETAFAGLQLADMRLRPVDRFGQIGLGQIGLRTKLLQEFAEDFVLR